MSCSIGKYECNIGFLSGSIYLIHFCKEKNDYVASMLTGYKKIASNLPIVKLESLSIENLMPRINYFSSFFQVDLKNNTRIFCDKKIVVFIIQQFSKNFHRAKPFFLRSIRNILDQGLPPENLYFISSKLNPADGLSRLEYLEPKDFKTYLGKLWKILTI